MSEQWTDESGYSWRLFAAQFIVDGASFAFEIWALDGEDAERRIIALKETASIVGEIEERIAL